MALGAAGVQIGTAYLLCPEATISAVHRAALKNKAARHTAAHESVHGPACARIMKLRHERGRPMSSAAPAFPLATSASLLCALKPRPKAPVIFTALAARTPAAARKCRPPGLHSN